MNELLASNVMLITKPMLRVFYQVLDQNEKKNTNIKCISNMTYHLFFWQDNYSSYHVAAIF